MIVNICFRFVCCSVVPMVIVYPGTGNPIVCGDQDYVCDRFYLGNINQTSKESSRMYVYICHRNRPCVA